MKTPPERWTTSVTTDDPAPTETDRAASFLRHAIVRQPLSVNALAEIRRRLPDGAQGAPRRRLLLRVATGVALFLSGGGVVMSATLLGGWRPVEPERAPVRPEAAPTSHVRRASPTPPTALPEAPLPQVQMPLVPPLPMPMKHGQRRERPPSATHGPALEPLEESPNDVAPLQPSPVPAPQQPSAIAEESALIGAAMQRLRERDDAAGALALLDEHDRRFGAAGVLTDEATTTRVEALLRAGAFARALALLDGLAPRLTGRGRELRATRGELRAETGRCAEAIADFEALLSGAAPPDVIGERALYGRAACRARLGEHDAARADLEAYLAQFPTGRYAGRARAALEP